MTMDAITERLAMAQLDAAVIRTLTPLPVQPGDQSRVDEKYPLRGYRSIDARAGVNWGEDDERMST